MLPLLELLLPLLFGFDAQLEELLPLAEAAGGVGALAVGRLGPAVWSVPLDSIRPLLRLLQMLSVSLTFPFSTAGSDVPATGRASVSGFSSLSVFGSLLLLL